MSQTHNIVPLLLFHVGTNYMAGWNLGHNQGRLRTLRGQVKGVDVQVIFPSVLPLGEKDEAKNRCIKKSTSGSVAGAVMRVLVYDKWTYFILSVSGRNGIHLSRGGKGTFGSGLAAVVR